jgi:hypothetical protein
MPALCSIATIGDKLIVGQVDTSFLTASSRVTPGTAVLNGPVYIGATPQIGIARATCMIGPPLGSLAVPASLEVTGITNIIGSLNVFAVSLFQGVTTKNGITIKNALSLKNAVDLKNSISLGNAPKINNAPLIVHSSGSFGGYVQAFDFVTTTGDSLVATNAIARQALALAGKGFDIPHPTKENHRLRYICLEGPEVGAYIRGKLENNNIIELPEYWKNLVYPESITVNLTPIGQYQELFADSISQDGTKIKIKTNSGVPIKCYYTVFAERVTNDKLQPEYKGLTPYDYPGDNSEYALGGWDYATHKGENKTSDL